MNWAAVAAITSSLTGLGTIAALIYWAGGFRQQLLETRADVVEHAERLDEHSAQLAVHTADIARLAAWRDGYDAATRAFKEHK